MSVRRCSLPVTWNILHLTPPWKQPTFPCQIPPPEEKNSMDSAQWGPCKDTESSPSFSEAHCHVSGLSFPLLLRLSQLPTSSPTIPSADCLSISSPCFLLLFPVTLTLSWSWKQVNSYQTVSHFSPHVHFLGNRLSNGICQVVWDRYFSVAKRRLGPTILGTQKLLQKPSEHLILYPNIPLSENGPTCAFS